MKLTTQGRAWAQSGFEAWALGRAVAKARGTGAMTIHIVHAGEKEPAYDEVEFLHREMVREGNRLRLRPLLLEPDIARLAIKGAQEIVESQESYHGLKPVVAQMLLDAAQTTINEAEIEEYYVGVHAIDRELSELEAVMGTEAVRVVSTRVHN